MKGRTDHFTDHDWLYLIIKFGKLRLSWNQSKKDEFTNLYHQYGEQFLILRSKLMALRMQMEDMVAEYDDRHNRLQFSLPSRQYLTRKIKKCIPAQRVQNIINEAKNGINSVKYDISGQLLKNEKLYDVRHNRFFARLVIACNEHGTYTPPESAKWELIEKQLEVAGQKHAFPDRFSRDKVLDSWISEAVIPESACGGRTLQITREGKTYYVKFMRAGEDVRQFVREKTIHEMLHNSGFTKRLRSEIPVSRGLYQHPYDSKFDQFDDTLATCTDSQAKKYVYSYCFSASSDYVAYAYQTAPEQSVNIYKASESGLKKAASDIGTFARHGLMFDGIIPAHHSTKNKNEQRKWLSLGGVFEDSVRGGTGNYARYPGLMLDWSHTATNRPDISQSGLRDLGDSTHINNVTNESDIFKEYGISGTFHFEPVRNALVFFNALLDNFVAIFLLYGRLHQTGQEYHYHNPHAVRKLERFMEDIMDNFLREIFR